jgi:hypothetical protein
LIGVYARQREICEWGVAGIEDEQHLPGHERRRRVLAIADGDGGECHGRTDVDLEELAGGGARRNVEVSPGEYDVAVDGVYAPGVCRGK